MKKLLHLALFACAFSAKAQTIPNAGMEDWTIYSRHGMTMMVPTDWRGNDSSMQSRLEAVCPDSVFRPLLFNENTRVHSGSSAAKVTNQRLGSLAAQSGVLLNGLIAPIIVGGVPSGTYTEGGLNIHSRITKISAWLSYSPATMSDAGAVTVYAVKTGAGFAGYDSVLGSGHALVYGEQPYDKYDCVINYTDPGTVPDRLIICFFIYGDTSSPAGSALYIDDVTMSDPTGIETPVFNGETFKVFPNPAKNMLYIANTTDANLVRIYNMTGRLMQEQEINRDAHIDISALPAGSYMYRASTTNNTSQSYSGTFIKQ